ncbi:MAG: SH3 domain-containing protein [Clostridia bacterium]|nr:SH3 domain-containing protein [Clostridia bacterium]MBO4885764.1 SH3 domain-containing protein [Clostridia bacterium]MBR4443274.1 SH3 domain-containing protein [Clostridia bacterium]
MKKFRMLLCAALAAVLMLAAMPVASAAAYAYDYDDYTGLIGAMEIVNCQSYASLRARPDTSSTRLARVPLGAIVTNCWYEDEKFTYCVYDGIEGYILNTNLSFIAGPVGQEYEDEAYLGNMRIANCKSYASLRSFPDTKADLIARVPLGTIVTNVFYEDERFCYCLFGDQEGFILTDNLEWVSGGANADYLGECVIVNCISFASLRELPDTSSRRLARVPLGAIVTDCYIVDERFACCTYDGVTGYILLDNLGW